MKWKCCHASIPKCRRVPGLRGKRSSLCCLMVMHFLCIQLANITSRYHDIMILLFSIQINCCLWNPLSEMKEDASVLLESVTDDGNSSETHLLKHSQLVYYTWGAQKSSPSSNCWPCHLTFLDPNFLNWKEKSLDEMIAKANSNCSITWL